MRNPSGRAWVRAGVAGLTALLTFALVFWFAFARPWVAETISSRVGFRVNLGRLYPVYRNGAFVLVIRDVVVAGKAPFDAEPLAFCDRIEVTPGRPLGVDVMGLDVRLLAAKSADNVRGAHVPSAPKARSSAGGSAARDLRLTVHSGSVTGVIQLPGGHRVAARIAGLRATSQADGTKAQLSGVSLDLGRQFTVRLAALDAEITPARDVLVQGQRLSVSLPGAAPLLTGVAIEASASGRGWTLGATTPHQPGAFALQAAMGLDGVSAQLSLHDAALAGLAPLFDRVGLSLGRATASLQASAHLDLGSSEVQWEVEGQSLGIGVHHPSVDSAPLKAQFASGHAKGTFDWREGRLTVADGHVAPFGLPLEVKGSATVWGAKQGSLSATTIGEGWNCGQLQNHVAATSVRRALWGLELSGQLKVAIDFSFDASDWDKLGLDIRMPAKCTVQKEPRVVAEGLTPLVGGKTQIPDRPTLPVSPVSREFTPIAKMPEHLLTAFLTAEDAGFFEHQGFEPENIRKALVYDLERGRMARGASTITQQVAKNLFLSNERTLARKVTETVLTWRMDRLLPKRRVLELYLNLVELGPGIRGVGAAAQAYFGKTPADLTPLEAVHLASLPPNPRGFARRFREGSVDDGWLARLYDLVGIMGRRGHLSAAQVGAARGTRLRLRKI